MSNDNTTLSPFGEIEIPDVNVDANIFNTKKTDYGNVQLFFGQEPGLLDSIHKFYPKLWRLFKKLRKQDWDEEEFDFSLCNVEFKTCPSHVYERMINTLIWQWEQDSVASRSIAAVLAPFCSSVEVWVPYVRINDNENVHGLTYSEIIKGSFDNPDEVLVSLLEKVEPMRRLETISKIFSKTFTASHKYALKLIEDNQDLRNTVYMFLVGMYLMERVQFMASFAETFDICRKGYFPPIRAAVEKIAMDEFEIHAQFGQEVLRIVLAQPDGMTFYAECRDQIVAVINELFRSEITWLKWLRRDGDHEGFMTYDESVSWLEFNCTAAAVFLGLNEEEVEFNFVTKNPLPWMKSHMNLSDNQASPQEEDANAYMVNIIRPDDMGKVFEFKHPALAFMQN